MKDVKLFIDGFILYIYKAMKDGRIYVVAVEDEDIGYSVRNITLETNLTGQELERYIVYAMANYKPEESIEELSKDEVYDEVDNIGIVDSKVLDLFVVPEKKQTPVESILADILQLSYKERSDVLIALLDMM